MRLKLAFCLKSCLSIYLKTENKSIYHTKYQKMMLPYQEVKRAQAKLKATRANLKIARAKLHETIGLRVRKF